MPSRSASSCVRLRHQPTTRIPNARARAAISRPICPSPTMPSVRPYSPRAFEYSPCSTSLPQVGHLVGDPAVACEQQSHHQLGHGDRVLARTVGDEDAELRCAVHVDGVDAGAGTDDERQRRSRPERVGAHLLAADDQDVRIDCRISAGSASAFTSGSETTVQPRSLSPSMPPSRTCPRSKPSSMLRWQTVGES